MKRKIFCLCLCLSLALTCLAGCGGEDTGSGGGASGSYAYLDTLPDTDLGGYEFVIAEACYYDSSDRPNMEAGSSELADAILARNAAIEEKFNCKITYEYYDPTSFYNEVYPLIMSGEKVGEGPRYTYSRLSHYGQTPCFPLP